MIRSLFIFWFALIYATAQAGTLVEVPPAPTLPVYGQTVQVPERATYISDCAGVSEVGNAGCTTRYTWRSLVGNKQSQHRSLATTYNVNTGEVVALLPLPGDTDTAVNGVTPGGRVWGQSLYRLAISRAVEWDAAGTPTYLGVEKANAADDLGRFSTFNQLCDAAGCATPPNVYEIYALANSGDYVASYVIQDPDGFEHVSMCRASDYAAAEDPEDMCSDFYLSEFGVAPTRVAINAAGTVAYHNTYGTATQGLISQPGQTLQDFAGHSVPLSAINELGDAAGGNQIVRAGGAIEIVPLGVYSALDILGINSARTVVGRARLGTSWNASWRAVYSKGGL